MTMISSPYEREQLLATWVAKQFANAGADITLTPIASDAGFRRYFRFQLPLTSGTGGQLTPQSLSKWLAVDAPPQTEDSKQFIALARYLKSFGVDTPAVFAADEQQGFLLVEDFGDELLHGKLQPATVDSYYQQAFATLRRLQQCPDAPELIPRYDRELLHRELLIFTEWFVGRLLQYTIDDQEINMLNKLFNKLENSALEQPQTLVHRDFHSRNLLVCNPVCNKETVPSFGVIDFQGALWGACTYDLASLLRDCYIRWPADKVKDWALNYREQAINAGLLSNNVSAVDYLRWFDWIGLQRHIKVLGIFARLHLRDGKHHYLKDLPLVIRYTLEVAGNYPDLSNFVSWFTKNLLPLAQQQTWYSDYTRAGETQ